MRMYVYHLTSLENFKSILNGDYIYSRSYSCEKSINFDNTANDEIIQKRGEWNNYVPFHFTMDTPYTYAVRQGNPQKVMINLAFRAEQFYDENNKFTLEHPVSDAKGIPYTNENYEGKTIDIGQNPKKAELLVYQKVEISKLAAIYVGSKNRKHKEDIETLLREHEIYNVYVNE